MNTAPTISIKTLGCRLNQAEEADFAAQLIAHGFRLAAKDDIPDVILLHSCAVTRAAERDTYRQIRSWRSDTALSKTLIAVTGCAVACNPSATFADAGADLVIAKKDQSRLAEMILAALEHRTVHTDATDDPFPTTLPYFTTKRALLKVQDGCGFKCAYCIVPYTRGAPVSRPWQEALDAARALLDKGFKELVLTGCNLACYRDASRSLADLTDAVCELALPYSARIRLGSVEPGICDSALKGVMAARPNLCRFFHFPVQSGDGAVLKAMGRHYSAEAVEALLADLRDTFPRISLNADFITGLPGEDETAFKRTCDMIRRFLFAHIHVFPYSPRQGTRAPGFAGCPSRTVAKERAARLRAVGDEAAAAYRALLPGYETEVLIEGRLKDGTAYGWNGEHIQCRLAAPGAPIASLVRFTPTRTTPDGLI